MTIERLLEAVMRLARAEPKPYFQTASIEVDELHTFGTRYELKRRKATVSVFRGSIGTSQPNGHIRVGTADVDVNGIILALRYEDTAPWWAVNPFRDAMAGK